MRLSSKKSPPMFFLVMWKYFLKQKCVLSFPGINIYFICDEETRFERFLPGKKDRGGVSWVTVIWDAHAKKTFKTPPFRWRKNSLILPVSATLQTLLLQVMGYTFSFTFLLLHFPTYKNLLTIVFVSELFEDFKTFRNSYHGNLSINFIFRWGNEDFFC